MDSGSWRDRLQATFGLDLRSLAALRVLLGGMLLVDLCVRVEALSDHYSDLGLLPRAVHDQYYLSHYPGRFSVHMWSGEPWAIGALFALAALCAVPVILGYRTRLFLLLSWLLLISLQNRNEMIETGGDYLLRLVCFWGLLLPLGARFSVDSAMNSGPRRESDGYLSVATFALIAQMSFVYVFSAMHKHHAHWREDFLALHYALHIDAYATPLGQWLRQYREVTRFLTRATLAFEYAGPALIYGAGALSLLPGLSRLGRLQGPLRTLGVLVFMGFHLMLGLFLALGTFPWFALLVWVGLLPGWAWDRLFQRLRTPARLGLTLYYDGQCGFCRRGVLLLRTFALLPQTQIRTCQDDASVEADMHAHNSWVVVDSAGARHFAYDAVVTVLDHSPVLAWLGPLYRSAPLRALGDRLYPWVANHRLATSRLIAFAKPRPLRIELPVAGQVLAAVCLLYVCLWNLRTVDSRSFGPWVDGRSSTLVPDARRAMQALRLDQHWGLFAPYPRTSDGWYVMDATLANGEHLDLLREDLRLTWKKPRYVSRSYRSFRWRKYYRNIRRRGHRYRGQLPVLTQYYCDDYNRTHRGPRRALQVDLYFMRMKTQRAGGYRGPQKRQLWHRSCR